MIRASLWLAASAVALATEAASAQTLQECLALARKNAPALRVSEAAVSRAEQAVHEARAARRPTLDLGASYTRESEALKSEFPFPGSSTPVVIKTGSADALELRTQAQLRIYSGGRDGALTRAAEAARSGQERNRDQAEADMKLRVSQAFYRALAAQRLELAAVEALDSAQAHLRTSAARVRAGMAQRVDSLRAEVDVSQRTTGVLRSQEEDRLARIDLENAMGTTLDSSQALVPPDRPVPDVPDAAAAVEAAQRSRPELAAYDQSVRETELRIRAARAVRRPQVTLNGTARYIAPNRNEDYFDFTNPGLKTYRVSGGVVMSLSVLDGGLASARAAQLEADRTALVARRRAEELEIRREVEGALADLRVGLAVWRSNRAREQAAREALRLAEAGYRGGTSTAADVRDAEAVLADAVSEEARSQMDVWMAWAAVDHAVGTSSTQRGE